MLDCTLRYCFRHPRCCFYLIPISIMLSMFMLLYHAKHNGIASMSVEKSKILYYSYSPPIARNSGRSESKLFVRDEMSWIKERTTRLDTEFFASRDGSKFKSGEVIPMAVIEEHHGVIPYWFGSVDSGILPHKHGNTLVHIDAHSDFGNPDIGPSFPTLRWPQRHELLSLMQANDRFIVSTALTGMFSRLIWVYPDWDPTIPKRGDTIAVYNFTIGHEILPDPTNLENGETGLCTCIRSLNLPALNFDFCLSVRNGSEDVQESPIHTSQCRLMNKTVRIEMVRESTIVDLISRKDSSLKPLNTRDIWILDIDEDFFGVEAPVLPMYKTNMSDEVINDLSLWVLRIFCAKTADEELDVDLIFQKVLQFVLFDRRNDSCGKLKGLIDSYDEGDYVRYRPDFQHPSYAKEIGYQIDCATHLLSDTIVFNANIPHVKNRGGTLRYDARSNSKSIFCPHRTEMELVAGMGTLLSLLYRLTDEQLVSLAEVGICLWSSIPSGDRTFTFKVCDGYNRPNNDSMVYFYTPADAKEIQTRAGKMTEIIRFFSTGYSSSTTTTTTTSPMYNNSSRTRIRTKTKTKTNRITTPPRLITLVRSTRDGYAPRSLLSQIESSVMKSLRELYEGNGLPLSTFYDMDLFGGVQGWYRGRYRLPGLF